MTSVYVTNVVRRVTVHPGYTGGAGSAGTNLLPLNNAWAGTNAFNDTVTATASSASAVPIIAKGFSGQTGNLQDWRNSANTVLASVLAGGSFSTADNIYLGGGVSASGGNKVLVLTNATPPSSNPTGGGILYADAGALKYRDSAGAIYVPIPLTGTKGDVLAHNGSAWVKLGAGTNGYVLTADSGQATGLAWSAGGAGGGHTIQDEGSSLTQRTTLDFQGAGVVATDNGSKTVVTISGGSSYYQTVQANGTARTQRAALNFGSQFTVTDNSGSNRTDITLTADGSAGTASLRTLGTGSTQASAGTHTHAGYEATGTAASLDAAHVAASNPHTQYLDAATADSVYATLGQAPPNGGASGYVLGKTSTADYAMAWIPNNASVAAPLTLTGTVVSEIPLTVVAANGQTSNMFQVKGYSGSTWLGVTSLGETMVGNGANLVPGMLRVVPWSSTSKGMVVRGKAGQSVSLIEAQDSSNNVMFEVGADGTVVAPNIGVPVQVLDLNESAAGIAVGTVLLRRPT